MTVAYQYGVQENAMPFNPENTLIRHLLTEDGQLKELFAYFIDSEGEVANIPIRVQLDKLSSFVQRFENLYLVFRDEDGQLLFEVSDGLLCYISQDINITRKDIREVLYQCGVKNIR